MSRQWLEAVVGSVAAEKVLLYPLMPSLRARLNAALDSLPFAEQQRYFVAEPGRGGAVRRCDSPGRIVLNRGSRGHGVARRSHAHPARVRRRRSAPCPISNFVFALERKPGMKVALAAYTGRAPAPAHVPIRAAPDAAKPLRQRAHAVLMVRPAAFGWNPETAASNRFQRRDPAAPGQRAATGSDGVRCAGR